nr:uncharacterized protein LOC102114831 [Macaca fascicularis]
MQSLGKMGKCSVTSHQGRLVLGRPYYTFGSVPGWKVTSQSTSLWSSFHTYYSLSHEELLETKKATNPVPAVSTLLLLSAHPTLLTTCFLLRWTEAAPAPHRESCWKLIMEGHVKCWCSPGGGRGRWQRGLLSL